MSSSFNLKYNNMYLKKRPVIILSTIILLLLFATYSISQPTISSFAPVSGPTGQPGYYTTITIKGSGFAPTPSNNSVFFGAVKAIPTSGSSSSLSVVVPPGANYQNLSVVNTNTGLSCTAYSQGPFIPIFTYSGGIANSSFGTQLTLTSAGGSGLASHTICDLDGDGKPEIIVGNTTSNGFSVSSNNSSFGSLNLNSFSLTTQFATSICKIQSMFTGDFDGDGKPDIVGASAGNVIVVLRNTSTRGSLSFDSTIINVSSGAALRGLALADMDGDGKLDIIACDATDSIVIIPNTSSIGTIQVSTAMTVATGNSYHAYNIAIADLNADGKPDIAISYSTASSYFTIFQNNSSSKSNFQLSTPINTNVTTIYPYNIRIGDIDKDGKPDIILSGNTSCFIYLNTSPNLGVIQISPTYYSLLNNPSIVTGDLQIADIDGDGKPDVAICTKNGIQRYISAFQNNSSPGNIIFGGEVDFGPSVDAAKLQIADLDGDGKPEICYINSGANDNNVCVIRNTITTAIKRSLVLSIPL